LFWFQTWIWHCRQGTVVGRSDQNTIMILSSRRSIVVDVQILGTM
jgi:hypothetical protein